MQLSDVPSANALGDRIHVAFPEGPHIIEERQRLFPACCLSLWCDHAFAGYLISHPWHLGRPPSLDALLGEIPPGCDTFYIHDLAVASAVRGRGFAGQGVARIKTHAAAMNFSSLTLISVNKTLEFWQAHGFRSEHAISNAAELAFYGNDASYMRCDF